jgi:hypothetical protein
MTDHRPSSTPDTTQAELALASFPASLADDVRTVLDVVPPGPDHGFLVDQRVVIEGESIGILSRLYRPEPTEAALAALAPRPRLIARCLYSRHHDGHVRERHLRRIEGDEPWLPHFVLLLVGDHVPAIVEVALSRIGSIPRSTYDAFAAENPAFMDLIRARVTSYARWSEPSRAFASTPGYRFLAALDLRDEHTARRLLEAEGRARAKQ